MTNHRTDLRAFAYDAINRAGYFSEFTGVKAWAQSVDSESLPMFGVSTPRENSNAVDTESHQRQVDLHVVLKRMGCEEIEDVLDADADALEALLLPRLRQTYLHAELTQTEVTLSGEGRMLVGMIAVTFACMLQTDMPV